MNEINATDLYTGKSLKWQILCSMYFNTIRICWKAKEKVALSPLLSPAYRVAWTPPDAPNDKQPTGHKALVPQPPYLCTCCSRSLIYPHHSVSLANWLHFSKQVSYSHLCLGCLTPSLLPFQKELVTSSFVSFHTSDCCWTPSHSIVLYFLNIKL